MSTEDLSPERLEQLKSIRLRRTALAQETSNDFRELVTIASAAETRRSEKRHRFMLLADISALIKAILFFGAFVLGLLVLLLAIGTAVAG